MNDTEKLQTLTCKRIDQQFFLLFSLSNKKEAIFLNLGTGYTGALNSKYNRTRLQMKRENLNLYIC